MPRRLIDRCQTDSIREFRASAQQRYEDGLALAGTERRTAAIYLWGYASEMTLKAAYFSFSGLAPDDALTWSGHIQPAINRGRGAPFLIAWPPQEPGHNVQAWAELLVAERAMSPGGGYHAAFAADVQAYGQRIWQLWRATLRYHKNRAYVNEVRQVREATEWFLVHSHDL
jgi:hypothetical protein